MTEPLPTQEQWSKMTIEERRAFMLREHQEIRKFVEKLND